MRTLFVLSLVACGNSGSQKVSLPGEFATEGEVLVTANGQPITEDMMAAVTRLIPPEEIVREKRNGSWVQRVEQVAYGEILYRGAIEKGLHKDPKIQKAILMAAREVLAQENYAQQIEARVTDKAIEKFYKDRAVQYKRPQARARHILVRTEAQAKELMGQLKTDADWDRLANEHTLDTATKDKGGDLGFFKRDLLDPKIGNLAFESDLKTLLGPIETRFGFHVMEVLERRDMIPLEDVKGEIRDKLRQTSAEVVLTQLKADVKLERKGSLQEIYDKTANWGTPENPLGEELPKARADAGHDLPGVRDAPREGMVTINPPKGAPQHGGGNPHAGGGQHGDHKHGAGANPHAGGK